MDISSVIWMVCPLDLLFPEYLTWNGEDAFNADSLAAEWSVTVLEALQREQSTIPGNPQHSDAVDILKPDFHNRHNRFPGLFRTITRREFLLQKFTGAEDSAIDLAGLAGDPI